MKTSLLNFAILALLFMQIAEANHFFVIGVFSICDQEPESFQMTKDAIEASVYQNVIKDLFHKNCLPMEEKTEVCQNFTGYVSYEEYQVCHNQDLVIKAALELNFDKKFRDSKNESNVLLVIAYLDEGLMKILLSLMLEGWSNIAVTSLNQTFSLGSEWVRAVEPSKSHSKDALYSLVKYYRWERIGVLYLRRNITSNKIDEELYRLFLDSVQGKGVCYYSQVVNIDDPEEYEKVVYRIKSERRFRTPKILFGDRNDQIRFVKVVEYDFNNFLQHFWVLHNVLNRNFQMYRHRKDDYISIDPGKGYWVRKSLASLPNLSSSLANTGLNFTNFGLNSKSIEAFVYSVRTTGFRELNSKRSIYLLRILVKHSVRLWNSVSIIFVTRDKDLAKYSYIEGWLDYSFDHVWKGPERYDGNFDRCWKQTCEPGRFQLFQNQRHPEETQWNHSIGWSCIKCPVNTFKPMPGDFPCQQCPSLTVSNRLRTSCYDPYRTVHTSLKDRSVLIFLSISMVLSLWVITIAVIFIVYRNTPLVCGMDFKLSILHLLLQLLITVSSIYSFQGRTTVYRCVWQPTSICILSTTSISIKLVKSQKLLQVFQSKIKIELHEMRKVAFKQTSIVLLNLTVAALLLYISIKIIGFDIKTTHDPRMLIRRVQCDMSMHVYIQVAFQICLQISCFVPAFRSRKLPNIYSDAITILYLCFTLVVLNSTMFPILLFQKTVLDKIFTQWAFTLCNVFVTMLVCYTPSVHIILFKKHKNTRTYFRQQTMASVQRKVRKLTK